MKTISKKFNLILIAAICLLMAWKMNGQSCIAYSLSYGSNGLICVNISTPSAGANYTWNIGGTGTVLGTVYSNTLSTCHVFTANGSYSLMVFSSGGTPACNSSSFAIVTITNVACSANFSSSNGINGIVNFTSTSINTTSNTSYNWAFGNGTSTLVNGFAGINASATFTANGIYNVTLTINTPSTFCNSTITKTVSVNSITGCSLQANMWPPTTASPGVINFSNNSTGTVSGTTYTWNFGNGVNSNSLNPIITYTSNGNYNVTLTANNNTSASCISSVVVPISVVNICSLNPSFTYSNNGSGLYTFSGTGGNNSGAVWYTYMWGSSSNTTTGFVTNVSTFSTTHTFTNGVYTVTLSVANYSTSGTCTNQFVQTITVSPVCNLTSTLLSSINATLFGNSYVSYTVNTSGTPSPNTYTWNYGYFNVSSVNSSTFGSFSSYPNGTYTVSVVSGNSLFPSCTSTSTLLVIVSGSTVAPCTLTANFNYTLGSNGAVTFSNTSLPTSGVTFNWNFGNGLGNTVINTNSLNFQYQTNGTYSVVLTATSSGCASSITSSLVVITNTANNPCAPLVNFSHFQGSNSGLVYFFDGSTNVNTVNPTYLWKFGDGVTSALINPTHTYSLNGVYNVTLQITNSNSLNCSSSFVAAVTITNACAGLAAAINYTVNGGQILISNASINTSSLSTYIYQWDVGNNWMYNTNYTNTPTFSVNFLNGNYNVALSISNATNAACQSNTTAVITVTNSSNCNITAAFTNTFGNNGLVGFTNNSTGTNAFTAYNWDFGDGGTSVIQNPVHTYTSNGTYTVTSWVTDPFFYNFFNYCRDSVTSVINVSITPCPSYTANFTQTLTSNGLVNFTDASIGTNSNTIYGWNFGDGWTSAAMNPNHTYSNAGTHYVEHSIHNSGCPSDSVIYAINITGIPCIANANFSLVPTNTPQYWNAILAYPYNITSANWSWGDGGTSNTLYASHQYSAAANYSICLSVTASCGATATSCYTYNVYKGNNGSSGVIYVSVVPNKTELETGVLSYNFEHQVKVYPNPNQGHFNISLNDLDGNVVDIEIIDILGNIIYSSNSTITNKQTELELNLGEMKSGLYILKITSDHKQLSKKIIISH